MNPHDIPDRAGGAIGGVAALQPAVMAEILQEMGLLERCLLGQDRIINDLANHVQGQDRANDVILRDLEENNALMRRILRDQGIRIDQNTTQINKVEGDVSEIKRLLEAAAEDLLERERQKKDDVLFEALGTVDELCSVVGVVYAELNAAEKRASTENGSASTKSMYGELPEQLLEVMSRLSDVGSHVAKPVSNKKDMDKAQKGTKGFPSDHTAVLEEWIDAMTEELPELTSVILPTGSVASSNLHVARTLCRRAERRMVPLVEEEETCYSDALSYVKRLSDYLFTVARYVNFCNGSDETSV